MSPRSRLAALLVLALSLSTGLSATAQNASGLAAAGAKPEGNAERLTAAQRDAIVERLAQGLEEGYVLEEKGRVLATKLRQMAASGRFTAEDPEELATVLTQTLREASGDLHLRVTFGSLAEAMGAPRRRMVRVPVSASGTLSPAPGSGTPAGGPTRMRRVGDPEEMGGMFQELSARFPDNYRAKILPGNVGLVEIDILFPPNDRLAAAMQELADTEALILDVRFCPGGTNLTVLPLESAFFAEPTLLRTMAHRVEGPQPIETVEETPGDVKYLDKPLFILVSNATGSGCEELAWTLKYHDKAVLIGETTAGAGHGITGTLDLGHNLTATVPSMRPIHPRFEGGWEGVGVPPDVTIAARRAADEAHLMALAAIMERAEEAGRQELVSLYGATAMEIGRREREFVEQGRSLRGFSATFENGHRLHVKDGELHYTAEGRARGPLAAMEEEDHFAVTTGMKRMVLRVERDAEGEIEALAVSPAGAEEWQRFERVPVL